MKIERNIQPFQFLPENVVTWIVDIDDVVDRAIVGVSSHDHTDSTKMLDAVFCFGGNAHWIL